MEKEASVKWKKWLGILLILLVIGAGAGHFYAKKITAPGTSINPIYNALVDKDMAGFYSELGIDKKEIDADGGKSFMEHVQAQDMEQLLKRLNDGARNVYKNGITKVISHEDGTELFKMKQRKTLGVYPVVIVEVSLQNFNLITTHKEVTKAEELSVRESEKETMPIAELKSESLYSTVVKDGKNEAVLYILPVAGSVEELEEPSFMGEAGDKIYSGELELYLANEHGEYGFLQEQSEIDMSGYSMNLDRDVFKTYSVNNETLVGAFRLETQRNDSLVMWHYYDGEMKDIRFDNDKELALTSKTMKFIEEAYMQSYLYFAGEDETGWIFKTWVWKPKESRFTGYDTIEYTDKEEYGRENGGIVVESWQANKHDYAAFPRLTLPENMKDLIKQGMLLDNGIHIGKSIDEVLAEFSNHVGHDYYNGGKYYKYPNGVSVFYDEITREVSNIMVGGRTFVNDLASVELLLGNPIDQGYDEVEQENYKTYLIEPYEVTVYSTESGEFSYIWLRRN